MLKLVFKLLSHIFAQIGFGSIFYSAAIYAGMNEIYAFAIAYCSSAQLINGIDAIGKIRTAILSIDSIRESFLKVYEE